MRIWFALSSFGVAAIACSSRQAAPRVAVNNEFPRLVAVPTVSDSEWPSYGRTPYADRHSPLRQIDTSNVSKLEVAWRFHTGEGAPAFSTRAPTALEVTPLVFRGAMYLSTPLGSVFALDPVTGTQRWVYDPQIDRTTQFGDFANRGVALWADSTVVNGSRCSTRTAPAPPTHGRFS